MLTWFECDKGWFGVKPQHRRMILELFNNISYESKIERIEDIPPAPLSRVIAWAEDKGIPYEIREIEKEGK